MKSRNCNGNCNGQWNESKEKKHLKVNNSNKKLNVGGVAEIFSDFFVVLTGDIYEVDPCGQNQAAESELRHVPLRFSRRTDQMRRRRGVEHRGKLELTRFTACTLFSRE